MLQHFQFTEAGLLMQFLEEHREHWMGQKLVGYYCDVPMPQYTRSPIVFDFEDFTLALEYPVHSDITLHIMDRECGALFPGMWALQPMECSCLGQKLTYVKPNRFSYRCKDREGKYRPDSGDYFNFITLGMEGGTHLTVNSSDYYSGGYARAFTDACRNAGWVHPPISPHARTMQAIERDFGEGFAFSAEPVTLREADLEEFTAGTAQELADFRGCHVLQFTGGSYPRVVQLHRKIPTFDSADREYDSWHKLYLIQKSDGKLFAAYAKGGYRLASLQGFRQVNELPGELTAFFEKSS